MFGAELDLVAPSGQTSLQGDIWTLDRAFILGYNPAFFTCDPDDFDYDCKFGGTSAACPQVAGVATLVMLRRPDLVGNTEQIREIIRRSSEDRVGDYYDAPGWDYFYGWGRLNAARALLAVVRGDADNNGALSLADATLIINYIFNGGPPPRPQILTGDADGNGRISQADCVYLINYIFNGGPPPPISFNY